MKISAFWLLFWRLSFEQRGFAALKSNLEAGIVKLWLYSAILAKLIRLTNCSILRLSDRRLFVLGHVLIISISPKYRLL